MVGNSLKFTESGRIIIGCKRHGESIVFYVKDTGEGMDEEQREIVFNQFVKLDRDQVNAKRGVGLGLAISKRLASLLGGDLSVESVLDEGSTFTLSLPYSVVNEKGVSAAAPIENDMALVDWSDKKILVVEDEETNYKYLKELLIKSGVKIDYATDGENAMQKFNQCNLYDVVLMDIKMPKMDGYDTIEKMRQVCPNQVIIAQTAYARPEDKHKIMKTGFTDYISKPILPKELLVLLEKHL